MKVNEVLGVDIVKNKKNISAGIIFSLLLQLILLSPLGLADDDAFCSSVYQTREGPGYEEVNITEAKNMVYNMENVVIIDVQEYEEYLSGHVQNAVSIPLSTLSNNTHLIPTGRTILTYGKGKYDGIASGENLSTAGFSDINIMCCGISGWKLDGNKVFTKYPSLQASINFAEDNSILYISKGTYEVDLKIDKNINLVGENTADTIIRSNTKGMNITADDVRINNFTFLDGEIGCVIYQSRDVTITNSVFEYLSTGIKLQRSIACCLLNNDFTGCGLDIIGDQTIHWDSHDIGSNNLVNKKPILYSKENNWAGNKENLGQIIFSNCSNIELSSSSLESATYGLLASFITNLTISNCNLMENSQSGAKIILSSAISLNGNKIEGNRKLGLIMDQCTDSLLVKNTFKDNQDYGLKVLGGKNNTIFNNTFIRNGEYLRSQGYCGQAGTEWDNGTMGNFWDNYETRYPTSANDGLTWDTAYELDGVAGVTDGKPLLNPGGNGSAIVFADAGLDFHINQHESVDFNGSGSHPKTGIDNYTWIFEYDGSAIALYGKDCSFDFNLAGIYQVTLKVTNTKGIVDEDVLMIYVKDTENPICSAGKNRTIMQAETLYFSALNCSDNVGIKEFTWEFIFKDKEYVLHGPTITFRFNEAGAVSVKLTIVDEGGNSADDQILVTVMDTEAPQAVISGDPKAYPGISTAFNALESSDNTGIANYTWHLTGLNTNITLFEDFVNHTFNIPGFYMVNLQVRDTNNNYNSTAFKITVFDIHPPTIYLADNISALKGEPVILDASNCSDDTGITNYTWSFTHDNENITLYGERQDFIFQSSGSYQITLRVKDGWGNQNIEIINIIIEDEKKDVDSEGAWPIIIVIICILILLGIISILVLFNKNKKEKS